MSAQHNPAFFSTLACNFTPENAERWIWIGAPEDTLMLPPHVERTGWLDRKEALARLAALDIYVHMSLWEGLSTAILEAMVMEKPVVAMDIAANREIVQHGVTGFLGSTPEECVAHIQHLLNNAETRRRMGKSARQYVLEYHNIDKTRLRWSGLYKRLAASENVVR